MKKNIIIVCVSLVAAISFQGCINNEIKMDNFKDLCRASGGEIGDNSLICKCGKDKSITCPVGSVCNNNGDDCISHPLTGESCQGESRICSDGSVYECIDGKWGVGVLCPGGVGCDIERTNCAACIDNSVKCNFDINDNSYKEFICEGGVWIFNRNCPTGAICKIIENDNSYCGDCVEGEEICKNGEFIVCRNGQAESGECSNGASCTLEDKCGICRDGEKRCLGGEISVCSHGQWEEDEQCPNGASCSEDESGQSTCGVCINGNFICNNSKSYLCQNGYWELFEECVNGCGENGFCGGCVENSTVCLNMDGEFGYGGYLRTCNNNQWKIESCSVNSEQIRLCQNNLSCGICIENETKCENGKYSICQQGEWVTDTCPNDLDCKDNLKCKECDDAILFQCVNDKTVAKCEKGTWSEPVESCEIFCQDGYCINYECSPTDKEYCKTDLQQVGKKYVCIDNMWQSTDCPNLFSCHKDENTCGECTNGKIKCECQKNGDVEVCSEYQCIAGKWQKDHDCYHGASCMNSTQCGECYTGTQTCSAISEDNIAGNYKTCISGKWSNANKCTSKVVIEKDNMPFEMQDDIVLFENQAVSCGVDGMNCGKCMDGSEICHEILNNENNTEAYLFICKNGAFEVSSQCLINGCSNDLKTCRECDESTYEPTCKNDENFRGSVKKCINGEYESEACSTDFSCKSTSECGECINGKYKNVSTDDEKCNLIPCVNGVWNNSQIKFNDKVSCHYDHEHRYAVFGECQNGDKLCMKKDGHISLYICENGKYDSTQYCAHGCTEGEDKCN